VELGVTFSVPCYRPDGTCAEIYLKREDLNHTGAHKINNSLGQALLCLRMNKQRIIAETGAGQHGVATVRPVLAPHKILAQFCSPNPSLELQCHLSVHISVAMVMCFTNFCCAVVSNRVGGPEGSTQSACESSGAVPGRQNLTAVHGFYHGLQATVCAKFGLPCIIYMGAKDMERQALNVFRMRLLGAEVTPLSPCA
jgi:hypothetical protein